ncbi:ectonucleoside triphosphate diphosphohydrolase 3 [Plakobranchus ocellatus]|uniref:Ectonucleoside triphosphate diphosphohydrolase 3 n=1 Tax=Plakobranchus ocellatus TaxID=259542 RepID=A0AAV4D6E2_9GAST|nr:ectonucleoside triphosphate diphosphohydrolase 3 [Plakobranchus ocellatus]
MCLRNSHPRWAESMNGLIPTAEGFCDRVLLPPVHNKVISGFQALRKARAPVASLKPATERSRRTQGGLASHSATDAPIICNDESFADACHTLSTLQLAREENLQLKDEIRRSARKCSMANGLVLLTVWCLSLGVVEGAPINNTDLDYGILLDAGSSSTKLKVYSWTYPNANSSVPKVTLIPVQRNKFKPGLATFEGDIPGMTSYLAQILDVAKATVPAENHELTPLYVLATAGFRLLGIDGVREGMEDVEEILLNSTMHPFLYMEGGASVLSGEEEGVFAWIAANYLLGTFHDHRPDKDSVGILEMGGGSTQIAFIPHDPLLAEEFQITVGGRRYSLYVQSYLQFGLEAIRARVDQVLIDEQGGPEIEHPCMLTGDSRTVEISGNFSVTMNGSGNPEECWRIYRNLVASAPPEKCYLKPCAIGSVFQPSVLGTNFYATQAYKYPLRSVGAILNDSTLDLFFLWDKAEDFCTKAGVRQPAKGHVFLGKMTLSAYKYPLRSVGAILNDSTLDLFCLWDKAEDFCTKNLSEISPGGRKFASFDCADSLYIHALLTGPYGFVSNSKAIHVATKIDGNSIGKSDK